MRYVKRSPLAALLLSTVCAALLAACGGDDSSSSPAPGTSPAASGASATTPVFTPSGAGGDDLTCVLFTKAEAEQAIGEPLGNAINQTYLGTVACVYQPSPDRGVLLNVTKGVTKTDFETGVQQGAQAIHQQTQPVESVGEEAFWLYPYLSVFKKDTSFRLSVWSPQLTAEEQLARTKELAVKAAGRIS